ncbi:unnamed protein product [Didymodactylos carnosus]|uniref:Uncharacterized protein n=1 Tax=Didymodactylos carnosus TaxID=1234261 RepID=A0A8S2XAF4_9BILA|nr:unnamed protein product [Didymodactylos carnosus]CAF4484730.1 unnamed protein product [Didymodactylos carnosus]
MSRKSWIYEILCKSPIVLHTSVECYELTKFRTQCTSTGVKYTYPCALYKKFPSCAIQAKTIESQWLFDGSFM